MLKNLRILLLGILVSASTVQAQNRMITGLVTDGKEPVIGAVVSVKGTSIGTATDVTGKFSLLAPNTAKTLIVKYVGFKSKEVALDQATTGALNLEIALAQDVLRLEEAVVTALGVEKERRTLGYSAQSVGGDELRRSGEQNVIQSIAGKAAGVIVTGSGGTPGASSKIILRGNSTFTNENQPLLIVDGVPIDNSTNAMIPGDYPYNMGLQSVNQSNRGVDINPSDIESINILKGPAAASLYGVRAGSGAIIITTKKGHPGKKAFSVDLSSSMEISKVNKLPELQMKYSQGSGGGALTADKSASIGAGVYQPGATSNSWGNLTKDSLGIEPTDNVANFFETGYTYNNNISNCLSPSHKLSNFLTFVYK